MTIGSTIPARVSFNCDGVSKSFPIPIQAYQNTDITVVLTLPASAGGGELVLTLNSDYSLASSGTLTPPQWTLTTLATIAYAAGYTLQAFINPVQAQQTNYVQGQAFPSLAVQTNFDRLTQMVQRLQDQVNRCILAPDGDVSPIMQLPRAGLRALTNLGFDALGNVAASVALASGTLSASSIGGFVNPQTTQESAAIAAATAAGTPSPMAVNVLVPSHASAGVIYPERFGTITTGIDCSLQLWFAQLVQQQTGAPIVLGGKVYTGAINANYNNVCILGQGSDLTTISLPITTVAITSISCTTGVLTVTCSAAHGVWVGKTIRLTGTTNANFNQEFVVTAITNSLIFVCTQLQAVVPTGSGTGGTMLAANALEPGNCCDGNNATARTGLVIRGITLIGNRGSRPAVDVDLTDWAIPITAYSKYYIADVRCVSFWNGGVGPFINANFGYIQGYGEDCSFSAFQPPSLDFNASKHVLFDWVSNACNFGGRLLGNCYDINGRISIFNATIGGFIANNQAGGNECHGCNVDVTVEGGCSAYGVQVGTAFRSSNFNIAVGNIAGIGVQEAFVTPANTAPTGNTYKISTRNGQAQSCLIGGNGGSWDITSWQDGRGGAAGSFFAAQVDGSQNLIKLNVTDSATPQVRGINFTANSANNNLLAFQRNTLVSNLQDLGTNNWNTEPNAYTPTWTSSGAAPALGNGTLVGSFVRAGRMITANLLLQIGTTTTFGTGAYFFSLPTQLATTEALGSCLMEHSGVSDYIGVAKADNVNGIRVFTGAQPAATLSPTTPFTFVATDTIAITITYESAT